LEAHYLKLRALAEDAVPLNQILMEVVLCAVLSHLTETEERR
jgi:hypothetical protein